MTNKTQVTGIVAILLAIGACVISLNHKSVTVVTEPSNNTPVVAAVSSPDIPSPYISFGNMRVWGSNTTVLNTASTTACSLRAPAATSTLIAGSVFLSRSSTTASTVTFARSLNPSASTTVLGTAAVSANGTLSAAASTTINQIFAPNEYFVVTMAGGIGTFSPAGECNAFWMEL